MPLILQLLVTVYIGMIVHLSLRCVTESKFMVRSTRVNLTETSVVPSAPGATGGDPKLQESCTVSDEQEAQSIKTSEQKPK